MLGGDDDDDSDRRNSKAMDEDPMTKKERNKVIDTEDASRGPLSGCIRLADSSRVIQRLKVNRNYFTSLVPIFQSQGNYIFLTMMTFKHHGHCILKE